MSLSESEPRDWSPHEYQERAISMMLGQGSTALFLDPGLGKTSITLAAFKVLVQQKIAKRMLVICPMRVMYSVWGNEVEKWTDFNHFSVTLLHGKDKEKNLDQDSDIFLINPEGLKWLLEAGSGRLGRLNADVLCVDESSRFKATNTQRFKLLRPHIGSFRRRWILTGTPIPNGIMDIFGQIFILDLGASLGRYITHFRNKWFYQSGYGGYTWSPMPGAFEDITGRIKPLSLRLAASDHLKMPQLRIGPDWGADIMVDLPPAAMKIYKEVEDGFISKLRSSTVVAFNTAAAGTKLRQIANGAVYYTERDDAEDTVPLPGRKDWEEVHTAKLEALESLIEELGGAPLLLFYEFDHDRQRIQNKWDIPCITGTSGKAGGALVSAFNAGHLPVLLAHPASAGYGLNLQEVCHHVCMFGLTWNLEWYIQAIDRVYRQGQFADWVTVYRILARKTKDEQVAAALLLKDMNQNKMFSLLAA